jgi:phenylacetate-coenzyme A ligase PaaK-like adenylate-forming protein
MVRFHRHEDGSVSLIGAREHDLDRMRRFFARLHRVSIHYRAVMECSGLSPEGSPIEILGRFPPTSREDYRDILHPEALSRLSSDRFVCDYSSGSTGRCVLRLATPADELAEQSITEQVFRRAGMRGGDVFVCADVGFPEIYEFYARAARALGVSRTTYLHLNRDFGRSMEPFRRLAPNVFLTLPSLLARCWPHLRSVWPRGRSPIRSLIFMGEPMHPALRLEVAETLGCRVHSFYGTTETGGMAGECSLGDGCHFDPALIGATIARPEFLDEATVQGELSLTTWHLRDHPVVKYNVGDVVRVTARPCECGEASPRLTVVERTHEGFVLAGLKLRYQTVLDAFKRVAGDLDLLAITLSDLPESEGHTLMRLDLPNRFAPLERELMDILKYRIFELDDLYQFGLVRFRLDFRPDRDLGLRKLRRVTDRRRYLGDDP